jgi:hypothetical protein
MATFDLALPKFSQGDLDDEKQRRRIMNYLVKLDEQLRFVLNNLDAENFTETFQQVIVGSGGGGADSESLKRLENELGRLSTLITQTADKIESKAEAEEVNELGDVVRSMQTTVSQTAEKIELTAQKVETLDGTVTEHSAKFEVTAEHISSTVQRVVTLEQSVDIYGTAIDQNAEAIKLKAESSTVNALGETVNAHYAEFKVTSESVTSIVERVDAAEDTIGKHSSAIDQNADAISLQAESIRTAIDTAGNAVTTANAASAVVNGLEAQVTLNASSIERVEGIANGAVTTANEASLKVDGFNAAIEAKVSKETFDELGEKVASAEANITANTNAIALKVSQETFDELGQKVTAAEGSINTQAGLIAANASSIKGAVDAAGEAVTTATNASLKVDGLEGAVVLQASRTVGSMNCLRDSDKGLSSDEAYLGLFEFVGGLKPKAGEKVAIRIWGRLGEGRTEFRIYNTNDYVPIGTLEANEDGTYSGTFDWKLESTTEPEYNLTEDSQTHIAIYAFPRTATSTSTIDRIALVIGSSMPEWSLPAAETASSLSVQADKIAAEVNRATEAEGQLSTRITSTADSITAEVKKKANAGDPAVGVKTGEDSAVRVTITSEEFSVDVPGEDGDFRLNETGGYLPVLAADYVNAPNVAPMYYGPEVLYVNPNASGDEVAAGTHYRSLSSACARVSNKWLGYTVTIQLAPGMVESGGVTLSGVSGGKWLNIVGDSDDRAKLTARLDIKFCTAPISVNYLNIEPGKANIGIHAEGCNAVTVASCNINGGGIPTKDDGSACIKASRGTDMNISGCNLTNCYRSIVSHSGSTVTATGNEGNCNVIAAWAMCYLTGKAPTNKTTWGSNAYTQYAGQVLYADIELPETVVTPDLPPEPPTTTDFVYTHSDSYRGGWSYFGDDDIRQGWDGDTIYGVIWFNASDMQDKLNGKEVQQASLKLYMAKGVGREATVSVQLYGTDKAYDGRSGAPKISDWSYGDIGSADPGVINEFAIPTDAIKDIVNGNTKALVLKSNDTTKHKNNFYSRNYAKFAGETSATTDTKPRLTVVYK